MPKKRSKTTGRFERQSPQLIILPDEKTVIIISQVIACLGKLNWQKRLEFLLSPVEAVSQIALDLEDIFKHLEDTDAL